MNSTAADNVIASRKMLLTHGLSASISTENESQFISREVGGGEQTDHRRVTPHLTGSKWVGSAAELLPPEENQDCTN